MQKKILIVDDESHLRFLLEQTLEDLEDFDIELETAENGEIALNSIAKEKPSLIFLDVMMPRVNGFDVCSQIKSNDDTKDIYVVLLTAKGQEIDRLRGEECGANKYLTKPFDPDEILEIAANHFGVELDF
ncbi:MAG: two-component system response regulator [Candidatus Cloacimonadota bacterium]|nr:MAG: two-component system response regulator [Candidatus Cloacimonadota bacterium]